MKYTIALRAALFTHALVVFALVPDNPVIDLGYAQYEGIHNSTSG